MRTSTIGVVKVRVRHCACQWMEPTVLHTLVRAPGLVRCPRQPCTLQACRTHSFVWPGGHMFQAGFPVGKRLLNFTYKVPPGQALSPAAVACLPK